MNRLIAALALALFIAAPVRAASTYAVTTDASSTTLKLNGRLHMQSLAGVEQLVVDSVRGLFTWTYGIQASTANFTGSGATTYSVTTSSGISVGGTGGVTASWFSASTGFIGSLLGNATTATTATTATNIAGGAAGSVPYQTGSGATSLIAAAAGKLLSIVGTTPTWLSFLPTTVSVSTANVSPGFNGASELVQLNASTQYPALDGSLITGLTGTLSGGAANIVPVWTNSTTLGQGSGYITNVSTGIGISAPVSMSTASFQHNPWLGSPSNVSIDTSAVGGVLVLSVDGASQSSGCVVTMYWDATRNQMVETSTTTDYTGLSGQVSGVLYEGCAPNTVCKVITRGIVQIKGVSTAITNGITTSSTRCSSANNASSSAGAACGNNHCSGTALTAVSNGFLWAFMEGP